MLNTHKMKLIAAASSTLGKKSKIQLWHVKGSPNPHLVCFPLYPSLQYVPMSIPQLTSQPVHMRYLKWGAWMLLIGLIVILVNLLLIYIFFQYILVPYLF